MKLTVNWVRNEGNETTLWHFDFSTVRAAQLCFHRKIDMKIVCFSNALGKHHQEVLPYISIQICVQKNKREDNCSTKWSY